jgi:ribosomal protein S18 acetylase RimI-like enzyme
MQITDLRQIHSRKLLPLLEEEARYWLEELRWDYRPSLQLIQKFIDARSLAGYVALEDGQPAGYGFYVLEDQKGLIGGLFVSPRFPQIEVSEKLLGEMLASLRAVPQLSRIEAQLIPFGAAFERTLRAQNFRLYTRQFMLLELAATNFSAAPLSVGLRIERWNERAMQACARLIHLCYASHIDGEINDQYCSEAGATKFLKNIVLLRGCGQFQPEASFLLRSPAEDRLVGVVLTSAVANGVGHTTQICVLPGYQGKGLGRRLMETSIEALRARGFHALSLTVTAANSTAVRLYERLGFSTIKSFAAGVWQPEL